MAQEPKENANVGETTLAAMKTELSSQIAKLIIGTVIGAIGLAALGLWLYVKSVLPELAGGVPAGAVVAFDSSIGCPKGWTKFEAATSRTIVGALDPNAPGVRNLDINGQYLTGRAYLSTGGEERHTLTVDEMPSHNHAVSGRIDSDFLRQTKSGEATRMGIEWLGKSPTSYFAPNGAPQGSPDLATVTQYAGGGKPHSVLPPFVALYYCRKD